MKYWLLLMLTLPLSAQAAEVRKLAASDKTWDGGEIMYPTGPAEITAIKIVLKPGEEMPFHCHPYPIVGYVVKGTLVVEKLNGESHTFEAGEPLNEVINTWHRGKNLSKTEAVELVGFYAGVKGKPNSIAYSEENKNACKI